MSEFIKKNLTVIIAFALPILLIAGVTVFLYLPTLFVKTEYNFVYATCSNGDYYYGADCNSLLRQRYSVVNNRIVYREVNLDVDAYGNKRPVPLNLETRVFVHNTKTNTSTEVGVNDMLYLQLASNLLTSPDGVSVSRSTTGGDYFFPFGGSSYSSGWYLIKGNSKKKMNLINSNDRYYYADNIMVLGWTK